MRSAGRLLPRLFALTLLTFALVGVPHPQAPLAQEAPSADVFGDALWLAGSDGLTKLAAEDGEPLLVAAEDLAVRTVSVDGLGLQVWAFGEATLRAVGFDGQPRLSVPVDLPLPQGGGSGTGTAHLAAHDGVVWLGGGDALLRFDDQGVLQQTLELPENVRSLAVDPTRGVVRVATTTQVLSFDPTGSPVGLLDFGPGASLQDLSIDRESGDIWVVRGRALERLSSDGESELVLDLPNLRFVATDGTGRVWGATPREVFRIGSDGTTLLQLDRAPNQGSLVGLATDPHTSAVWLATPQTLIQIGTDGMTRAEVERTGSDSTGSTTDLTLYADLIPPELAFVSPEDGAVLTTAQPTLELTFEDVGQGVDGSTLEISRDGQPVPVTCDVFDGGATCVPDDPLPEGEITLSATVADLAGNVSAPATVTFVVDLPDLNQPPVLAPVGDRTVGLGNTLTVDLEAVDPDGDPLTFGATPLPLPAGASLNGATGLFQFAPTPDAVGTVELTFSVSDGLASDAETVRITVPAPDPDGPTALAGRILDTNDFVEGVETPIVGATVSLVDTAASAVSGADGRFLLSAIPAGEQVLLIDTSTADLAPDGSPYAGFGEQIVLIEGVTNTVERPFFLPRIARESLTTVDPFQTTVVDNATLGVTMTVAPLSATNPDGSLFTGELSVSEVPAGLAPAALPEELQPGLLLTIQPVGVQFTTPAPLTFPNIDDLPPGTELDLWSLDADEGVFDIVGTGRVSADGSVIETISGGITSATWHSFLPPQPDPNGEDNNDENQDPDKCDDCDTGSQTALRTGELTVSHDLPTYLSLDQPRGVSLVYTSLSADPQPVISSATTVSVRAAVPNTLSATLEVGGSDQGFEAFTATTGLSESRDETVRQAVQLDAGLLSTGAYPYRLHLRSNYGTTSIGSIQSGRILVHNRVRSPLGAGWGIEGLERLHTQADNSVVITDGDGRIQRFRVAPTAENGLRMEMFDTPDPIGAVGNGFAGLSPGTFNVTSATDVVSTDAFSVPVVSFPDISFDISTFYNVGPNGSIDPGSSAFSPQGDDLSIVPPGGQDTFGARFSGFLFLPDGGDVTFTVGVDDAFDLRVDGQSVAQFLGVTDFRLVQGTAQNLPAGFVPITLNYGENSGEANIVLSASGGGLPGGVIPQQFLFTSIPQPDETTRELVSPAGDFSTLVRNEDGTFTRTFKDGTRVEYDAQGLQTVLVDRNGNPTSYAYDSLDRLVSITDPVGLETRLAYAGDQLSTLTDPAGRTTRFDHDLEGNLTRITDPDGTSRSFGYDARHRLIRQTSKRGFDTTYLYDDFGRNVAVNRPDGSTRTVQPAATAALAKPSAGIGTETDPLSPVRPEEVASTYTDGNGNVTRFETDRFGGSTRTVDPVGRVTTASRDLDGNLSRIVNPDGLVTTFTYDERGNLLTRREAVGTSLERGVSFEYEPDFSNVSRLVDAGGAATTFEYDGQGNLIRKTDPEGGIETLSYDVKGLLLSRTDPEGRTTTFTYDARGNVETVTDPSSAVTRFTRDGAGNIIEIRQAVGTPAERVRTLTFDAMDRVLTATDSTGSTVRFTYDAAGNEIQRTSPTGETRFQEFDPLDRVEVIRDPIRGTTTLTYDGNGNVVRVVDGQGNENRLIYDGVNRLVERVDPLGNHERFTYDVNDKRLTVEDALGRITRFEYDLLGRRIRQINPLGQAESFLFDLRGRLTRFTNARGQVVTHDYDDLSRRISTQTPDNSITFTYDAVGNVLEATDDDTAVTFTYDALDRLLDASTLDRGAQPATTLTSSYDPVGNRIRLGDSLGGVVDFAYDAAGRLVGIDGTTGGETLFAYDAAGRLQTTSFPNGIVTEYEYDSRGLLTELTHLDATGTDLASLTYQHDALGRITQIAEGSRIRGFAYDEVGRLIAGGTPALLETYTYDAVGNRTSSHLSSLYLYDDANRLLEDDDFTYVYDADGNLVGKTAKDTGAVTSYAYDAQDQLVGIDRPDGTVVTYRYDALGRRVEKNVDGAVTRFVYDGSDAALVFDGANQLVERLTHRNGIDEPVGIERGDETFFHLTNHQGSTRFLADETQTAVNRYEYDSFGNRLFVDEAVSNPFTYTGRELDEESGLYYYRARYYDPRTGRFLGEDPLGFFGGDVNLYPYVGNDPVNFTDPQGLFSPLDLLDVIFFFDSLDNAIDCPSLQNLFNLGLDTAGLLPLIPSTGALRKADDLLKFLGDNKTFERVVSEGELRAIEETGLLRGGREGRNFFTNNASLDAKRAQQRLGLDGPLRDYRVRFEITGDVPVTGPQRAPGGSTGTPGGGREFFTDQPTPIEIIRVDPLKK